MKKALSNAARAIENVSKAIFEYFKNLKRYRPMKKRKKEKSSMDLEKAKMIESRLNDPQKVSVVVTAPRMSFYEYWQSVKPLLEKPEPIIIILDDIHYKKLKPRKRRNRAWQSVEESQSMN